MGDHMQQRSSAGCKLWMVQFMVSALTPGHHGTPGPLLLMVYYYTANVKRFMTSCAQATFSHILTS